MFRIGFDPFLEAEQQHEEVIRNVKYYKLASLGNESDKPKYSAGIKILVKLGAGMANLGNRLVLRYGEKMVPTTGLEQQTASENCS